MWVPLLARGSAWPVDVRTVPERRRRLHLLLDGYGYDGDRSFFGDAVAARARVNASVLRRLAATGDPAYRAIAGQAEDLERSAREVEQLPADFWRRP